MAEANMVDLNLANMTTPKRSKTYKMNHANRGCAIIFNNSKWESKTVVGGAQMQYRNREGSEKDVNLLRATFLKLGFNRSNVHTHEEKSLSQIEKILKKVQRKDHTNSDCLVVCIMTHGEHGKLIDSDGTGYHLEKLWRLFTVDKCPTLAGKPKLFFVQACRSGFFAEQNRNQRLDNENVAKFSYIIPNLVDFLFVFSTSEDKDSYRGWFVKAISDAFNDFRVEDLLSQITMASKTIAVKSACLCTTTCEDFINCPTKFCQVPQFVSTLIRKVYFTQKEIPDCQELNTDIRDTGAVNEFNSSLTVPQSETPELHLRQDAVFFNMKHIHRGAALIFCNHSWTNNDVFVDLPGYKEDLEKLAFQLEHLGFKVQTFLNITYERIQEELKLVTEADQTDSDCVFVGIFTHGHSGNQLVDGAGEFFPANHLWEPFRRCKSLMGKPKLFLIQACRGDIQDKGTQICHRSMDSGKWSYSLPPEADFLTIYSTVDGFVTVVNPLFGSVFVNSFCKALHKCFYDDAQDLVSALTESFLEVALWDNHFNGADNYDPISHIILKQTPQMVSTLIRKLVFHDSGYNGN